MEELGLVPEVLRIQTKWDAESGEKWRFVLWGENLIRVIPPGAPAEKAVPILFAVHQRSLKMPLRLPLVEDDFWDPRGTIPDGRVLTSSIDFPGGLAMGGPPKINHVQISTPAGRMSYSTEQHLSFVARRRKRSTPPEASESETSDYEMHPGARNMTKKERRRHRKMNDNFFKPRVGGMQGPPTLKALLEMEGNVWATANPFQVKSTPWFLLQDITFHLGYISGSSCSKHVSHY